MIDADSRGRGMPRPYNTIVNNCLFSLYFVVKKIALLLSVYTITCY